MSFSWGFPKWGFSYKALYVPIGHGNWQCGLMLEREVGSSAERSSRQRHDRQARPRSSPHDRPLRSREFGWSMFDKDDDSEQWMNNRIARDRRDFLQMFEVRIDKRDTYLSREFAAYVKFIKERLCLSIFDLPADGAGIARILKRAVRDGQLIPVLNRDWSGHRAVFQHYAPQSWPASGGSGFGTSASSERALAWAEFTALRRANGELGDMGSSGTEWFDIAAAAVSGDMVSADEPGDPSSMFKGLTDDDTPLSDEAFEYEPDSLSDDTSDIAARNVKMTGNEPGGFRLNPNGEDTDYFDGDGNLTAQYHESHGAAHGHNYFYGERDKLHLPMSPVPRR